MNEDLGNLIEAYSIAYVSDRVSDRGSERVFEAEVYEMPNRQLRIMANGWQEDDLDSRWREFTGYSTAQSARSFLEGLALSAIPEYVFEEIDTSRRGWLGHYIQTEQPTAMEVDSQ